MAASCHSKRRITEEIGTVELVLDSMTLSQQRSIINGLIKSGTIEVAGRLYDLELVLVCDMKALTRVLNLYTCYHPKATWKCPWCLVHKDKLHNFDLDEWPLRKKEDWDKHCSNSRWTTSSPACCTA